MRRLIPADESFGKWKEDPKYIAEYNALENEFAVASASIEAQHKADITPKRSERVRVLLDGSQQAGQRKRHMEYTSDDVERLIHETRAEATRPKEGQ